MIEIFLSLALFNGPDQFRDYDDYDDQFDFSNYQLCAEKEVILEKKPGGVSYIWRTGLPPVRSDKNIISLSQDCEKQLWAEKGQVFSSKLLKNDTSSEVTLIVDKRHITEPHFFGAMTPGYIYFRDKENSTKQQSIDVYSDTGKTLGSYSYSKETAIISGATVGEITLDSVTKTIDSVTQNVKVSWSNITSASIPITPGNIVEPGDNSSVKIHWTWPAGFFIEYISDNGHICMRIKKNDDPSFEKEVCHENSDVDSVYVDAFGSPQFSVSKGVPKSVQAHSKSSRKKLDALKQLIPNNIGSFDTTIAAYNGRTNATIFRISTVTSHCDIYVSSDHQAKRLSCPLLKKPRPLTEIGYLQAQSGAQISTLFSYNKGGSKQAPLIVYIHGGPHDIDTVRGDYLAAILTGNGFPVLRVNYTGSLGTGIHGLQRIFGRISTIAETEISMAIRSIIAQYELEPFAVVMIGGSAGGYFTLDYVTTKNLIPAVDFWIAVNPVVSPPALISRNIKISHGHSQDIWRDAETIPVDQLDGKEGVVLYGEQDEVVLPFEHAKLINSSLSKVKIIPYSGGHSYSGIVEMIIYVELWNFLIRRECEKSEHFVDVENEKCNSSYLESNSRIGKAYNLKY